MATRDQPGDGWMVVLRRQPTRIVAGWPGAGYADAFGIICCDGGDHRGRDYSEVAAELQRIRGPYPIAGGVAAHGKHLGGTASRPVPPVRGRWRMRADRR
jgi:hypothetical protein